MLYILHVDSIEGVRPLRVIGTDKVDDFIRKHPDSDGWLKSWLAEARSGKWQSPNEIKKRYKSASVLDDKRVIFNVKGNNYRMEIQVSYKNQIVVIKRIGTHAEYNRWDS
jgi:mRNA interferase HigB